MIFPDTTGARPLREFRIMGSDGERRLTGGDSTCTTEGEEAPEGAKKASLWFRDAEDAAEGVAALAHVQGGGV